MRIKQMVARIYRALPLPYGLQAWVIHRAVDAAGGLSASLAGDRGGQALFRFFRPFRAFVIQSHISAIPY